jgi:hypothetical protein
MVTTAHSDDFASVCVRGHVINPCLQQVASDSKPFCRICGSTAITRCPNCQAPIEHKAGPVEFTPPEHCPECGSSMPWSNARQPHVGPRPGTGHVRSSGQTATDPGRPSRLSAKFFENVLASVVGNALWAGIGLCLALLILAGGTFWAFGYTSGQKQAPSPALLGGASAGNTVSQSPSPSLSSPGPTCGDPPANWPKTPQGASSAFGGQPYNWYPDYQPDGTWNGRGWSFQDSSLQHGVVLNSNGDYTDAQGQVLKLPNASRYELWDYGSPLSRPSLHLGQLGQDGRVQMFIRTGDRGQTWAMSKRWGFGSATFDEAEGGVANLVGCADDQLGRAAFDAHHDCVDGMANIEGYAMLLWNETTRRFESGACK